MLAEIKVKLSLPRDYQHGMFALWDYKHTMFVIPQSNQASMDLVNLMKNRQERELCSVYFKKF